MFKTNHVHRLEYYIKQKLNILKIEHQCTNEFESHKWFGEKNLVLIRVYMNYIER